MNRIFGTLILALAGLLHFSAPAQAQACQWNYALVPNSPAGTATATYCGNVSVAGTITGLALNMVDSIAAMQAIPFPASVKGVIVAGRQGAGDTFYWQTGALCDAVTGGGDGGTTFCASDGIGGYLTSGYWQRQYSGAIQTAWFDNGVLDIGQQYNLAYAAAPGYGGTIDISPSADGSPYNYSHGIVETTLGKCPNVRGLGSSGPSATGANSGNTILNFTPTTGTAWLTDCTYTSDINALNRSLSNITLINNDCKTTGGCAGNSATIGLEVGNTNGGDSSFTYNNFTIQGFGTGYKNYNDHFQNCCEVWNNAMFVYNTVALDGSMEEMQFNAGYIVANGKAGQDKSTNTKPQDLVFTGTVIVDNTSDPAFDYVGNTKKTSLFFTNAHLENSDVLTCHYFEGLVNVIMNGGVMEDDNSTGTCDWFLKTDDFTSATILGTVVSSPRTVTTIVDATNFVSANLYPTITSGSNTFNNLISGTFAANSNTCATRSAFTGVFACSYSNPLVALGTLTFNSDLIGKAIITSCSGKATGTIWNDTGTLKVCP